MKLLFLTAGDRVPSSRHRVQQYIPFFREAGARCRVLTIHPNVYTSGWSANPWFYHLTRKAKLVTLSQMAQRLMALPFVGWADAVIIQRPLLGISSPFLEERIARLHDNVIFDMDDAIFYHPDPETDKILSSKVSRILKACRAATCGNPYLRDYAAEFTTAHLIPTSVDTDRLIPAENGGSGASVGIGWIGQPSNFPYINEIEPQIARVIKENPGSEFLVGSVQPYQPLDSELPVTWMPWSAEKEVELLHRLDIGLMPLPDSPWAKGKCGGKLVEYCAAGIAGVSSDSVAARSIVVEGETGFVASQPEDWYRHLSFLVKNPRTRSQFGRAARSRAVEKYSIQKNYRALLSIYSPEPASR